MIPYLKGLGDSIGVLLSMYSHSSPTPSEPPLGFNAGELSSALVQSISDGIVVTDSDLTIQLINRGALRLFGFSRPEEAIGLNFTDLADPILVNRIDWVQLAKASFESMAGVSSEGIIYDVHRNEISVLFSMTTFLFSQRRYLCFALTDLRDKRLYEEKIRFLAFLSHELRTPIQVIVSGLHELHDQSESSDTTSHPNSEHLDLLIGASNIVTRVVESVLDLSKLESGTVKVHEEECCVKTLMETIVAIVRSSKRPSVELRLDIGPNVPDLIRIDQVCTAKKLGPPDHIQAKFEHILLNLINNALRHTKEGHVQVSVHSRTRSENGKKCLYIDVEDTGIGIKADDMNRLFKPYQVLDDPSKMHSAGK